MVKILSVIISTILVILIPGILVSVEGDIDLGPAISEDKAPLIKESAWIKAIGTYDCPDITIDYSGNIYVIGNHFWEMTLLNPTKEEEGGLWWIRDDERDTSIIKLTSGGDVVWLRSIGGLGNSDYAGPVLCDSSGHIYAIGYSQVQTAFNAGSGIYEYSLGNDWVVYVTQFDDNGKYKWNHFLGGDNEIFCSSAVLDGYGNIYITGGYFGTLKLDDKREGEKHVSKGARDSFLCKIGSTGSLDWGISWGGKEDDWGRGVVVDNQGDIYILGQFKGDIDLDPGIGIDKHASTGGFDIFVVKVDKQGYFKWGRSFGGDSDENCFSMAIDEAEGLYITGEFQSTTVDFDPSEEKQIHCITPEDSHASWNSDAFLSKIDLKGGFQWAETWGGSSSGDVAKDVSVDGLGAVYVTGGGSFFLKKFTKGGIDQWTVPYNGIRGDALDIDAYGNIYIIGEYYGTVGYDLGKTVYEYTSSSLGLCYLVRLKNELTW